MQGQLDGVAAAKAVAAGGDERMKRFVDEGPDKPFFDLDFAEARKAAHVERAGKGRAGQGVDAWRELERLLAMVAQPRAAKTLAVSR